MATNVGYVHEDAFDEGFLQVDQIHNVHYEQYGPRDGKPGKLHDFNRCVYFSIAPGN